MGLDNRFCTSLCRSQGGRLSCLCATPFPVWVPSTSWCARLSVLGLSPSDLSLDRVKRPLDRCPMLMLLTTLALREGLLRTCFKTAVPPGEATIFSAGWLKVKALLSSVKTPAV